jgi:hypothetical protein
VTEGQRRRHSLPVRGAGYEPGIELCNKIPEPKRYALGVLLGGMRGVRARGPGLCDDAKKPSRRGHNTRPKGFADGGYVQSVRIRSAATVHVKNESESWC